MKRFKPLGCFLAAALLLTGCAPEPIAAIPLVDASTLADSVVTAETFKAPTLALFTQGGQILEGPGADFSPAGGGRVRYQGKSYDALGVIANPPAHRNREITPLVQEALSQGQRALVLFIDGLGYDTYTSQRGTLPALGSLTAYPATGVYPTITPVNYAAMITGQSPSATGIRKRGDRRVQTATLFDWCQAQGYSARIIEGDQEMLALSAPQTLNPDLDGSGFTDEEVFASALACLKNEAPGLLFVHFHGVDEASHANGPHTAPVHERLALIDSYCGQLMAAFTGRVIAAADHGQHCVIQADVADYAGAHGEFRASDLIVPLMVGER